MKRTPEKPPKSPSKPRKSADGSRTDPEVAAFMQELEHPLKQEIETVRRILLEADPAIHEAIKWKSPSFRTTDFFATVNLRSKDRVQLVFHMGAKVKATATTGVTLADPAGLLEWLSKDRALVTLGAGKDFQTRTAALRDLVREWIRFVV